MAILKIANNDIPCYKLGIWDNYNDTFFSGVSTSWLVGNVPIQKHDYMLDKVQPTIELKLANTDISINSDSCIIAGGYHSFSSMVDYSTSLIYLNSIGYRRSMAMFIIPKGSKYYDDGEIFVSETIVFKKRYTRKEYLDLGGLKRRF